MILENFCKANNLQIREIYCDDGWSGSNFERPDFKRMMKDVEKGKINLIITKDLSRFGRDYILVGHYTEIYFPNHNIRYIAVDDGYDTDAPNEIGPIKNMFNDWYARDISKKVKNVFTQKALKGQLFNSIAPYGYIKDPSDKNHLILDPQTASNVQEIFQMTINYFSRTQIAKALAERKILIPSAYQGTLKKSMRNLPDWEHSWHREMVSSILRNQVYVGDMVNRKSQIISHKTKKVKYFSRDSGERIIVSNTHTPLVAREEFERIQTVMDFYNRLPKERENFFKGIIFCSECNHRMQTTGKSQCLAYQCGHQKKYNLCSHKGLIRYDSIKAIIDSKIRALLHSFKNDKEIIETLTEKSKSENRKDKLHTEKSKITNRIVVLGKLTKKLYEDYFAETLDTATYQSLITDYQSEQKVIKKRLEEIDGKLQKENDEEKNIDLFKNLLNQFIDYQTFTQEMVGQLINRIEVSMTRIIDGKPIREIKVFFNYLNS